MKKLVAVMTAVVLCLGIFASGCTKEGESPEATKKASAESK